MRKSGYLLGQSDLFSLIIVETLNTGITMLIIALLSGVTPRPEASQEQCIDGGYCLLGHVKARHGLTCVLENV